MKPPKSFPEHLFSTNFESLPQGSRQKILGLIHLIVFCTGLLGGAVMYFYDKNSFLSLILLGVVSFFGWMINRAGHSRSSAIILIAALLLTIQFNIFAGFGIHDISIIAWPAFIFFTGLLFGWRVIPYITALIMLLAVATDFFPNAQFLSGYSDTGDLIVMLLILMAFSLITIFLLRSNENLLRLSQRSDERFQAIYNSINEAILIHDPQTGAILDINEKMTELFGYTRREALLPGSLIDISSGIPPYTLENTLVWIQKTAAQGPQYIEWQAKDKSGRVFWVDINMKLATIDNQQQVLVSVRDITDRKASEAAVEESREKYLGLSDASFESIFISERGICLEQNQMAQRMFGYTDAEAIGRSGTAWIHPKDRDTVQNNMLSGYDQPYEVIGLRKDGSTFPSLIRGKMMHFKGRTVRVTAMNDITERKQIETALQESENMLRRAQEIAHVGHFKYDPVRDLVEGSDELFRIFGLTQQQFQFADFVNSVHPEDRASDLAYIESAVAQKADYEHEHRLLLPDGTLKWINMIGTFSTILSKELGLIIGTVQDITERKHAELQRDLLYQVHRAVSNQLEVDLVVNSAVETIVRLTGYPHVCIALPHEDGAHWVVRAAAGSLAAELGATYPINQGVIGRSFKTRQTQWVRDILDDPNYVRDVNAADALALRSELVTPLLHSDHFLGALNIESDRVDVFNESDVQMIQSVADMIALALENAQLFGEAQQEIIERKQAEEALRESEQRYRTLFEQASDGIINLSTDLQILAVNKSFARMHGYSVEEILNMRLQDLDTPESTALSNERVLRIMDGESIEFEVEHKHKDGHLFTLAVSTGMISVGGQNIIQAFNRDITERKRAEQALRENEEKYRRLFDNASLGIFQSSLDGKVISINPAFALMLGYDSPEDALKNIRKVATNIFVEPNRRDEIIHLITSQTDLRIFENEYRRKDGSTFIGQLNVTPVMDTTGQLLSIEGMVQNISERKQAEAKILAALEEKETLLREVHHRVKNNLQAMIALIDMQVGLISDANTRQFLRELEGQARTMALVYEQLYQSVNLARVKMAPYLQQLTYYISETFGTRHMPQLSLDIGPVALDVAQAMPCGLIVNELFTNILKHAFPPGFENQPLVLISLKSDGECCQLTIADNGVGLPAGFDWKTSRSLGMRLVNLWVTHQLGGTLDIHGEPGTTYNITFPTVSGAPL